MGEHKMRKRYYRVPDEWRAWCVECSFAVTGPDEGLVDEHIELQRNRCTQSKARK